MPPRLHIDALDVDITTLDVDAIVNAANTVAARRRWRRRRDPPRGGSGVAAPSAARSAAARPAKRASRAAIGCPRAIVIHTVGPVWHGGAHGEPELLASLLPQFAMRWRSSTASTSIAFPAISCGVYGYPLDDAVAIAVRERVRSPGVPRRSRALCSRASDATCTQPMWMRCERIRLRTDADARCSLAIRAYAP